MTTDDERAAVAALPALQPLLRLRECGWRITPVVAEDGTVTRLDGMRVWPDPEKRDVDWVDTVMVLASTDARALRANPDGDSVWTLDGTLHDVVNGLLALPPPGTPGAPRLVKGRAHLWTP